MMRHVLMMVLLCALVVPSAFAQRILIVTEVQELEVEGGGYLGDWLRSQGYAVDVDQGTTGTSEYSTELSQEQIDTLNSYNVVLVHREISSGNFNSETKALAWNEDVTAPIFMGSGYLPRDSRWQWISAGQQRSVWEGVDIQIPDHPVVAGLTGEFFDTPLGIDHIGPGDVGEGTVIATIINDSGEDANAIVAWEPGQEFTPEFAWVAGGARLFLPIYRYHEHADLGFGSAESDPADGSFENYTENGLQLIKQGIDWLATFSDQPSEVDNWDLY